jgi:predicted nucleic acid-binding protein
MQHRTAKSCEVLPKVGSNVFKILGKVHPRHRRNKQQFVIAKFVSVQQNVHQVLGHRLLLELHQKATRIKMKEGVDAFFCRVGEFVVLRLMRIIEHKQMEEKQS